MYVLFECKNIRNFLDPRRKKLLDMQNNILDILFCGTTQYIRYTC